MSDSIAIIQFFANVMSQIFLGLGSVKYEGISILQMFLAVMFFNLLVWFIQKIIGTNYQEKEEEKGIWKK